MTGSTKLEFVRISGFRSLASIEVEHLGPVSILIGPNGSGKSNFIRFFELLSWMLRSHRRAEFVERSGGADDQLFGGNRTTHSLRAKITMRTDAGINDYRFALTHVHRNRFMFAEETFRFS